MSWKKSKFASSLISLFAESPPDSRVESCTEDIREAMLGSLREARHSDRLAMVLGRVRCAPHVQALWYLRCDLMTLLAGQYGESAAKEELRVITDLFHGLLPAGQVSRPSPLSRH